MPTLLQIGFSNTVRLTGRIHYFELDAVRFKLIQNDPRRYSDVLLTLTPAYTDEALQTAYAAAGKFASALCWVTGFATSVAPLGAAGVPDGFALRRARCSVFSFPDVPFRGNIGGFGLTHIARVTSEEQLTGLTLYREGLSSNRDILSLLLHWQIIEITGRDPAAWVDGALLARPNSFRETARLVGGLNLAGRSLGQYLLQDCRHAIAHIRREPGRHVLRFDDRAEDNRVRASSEIVREFARDFIETELGVTEMLHLVRERGRGFPIYRDLETIQASPHTAVRPPPRGLFHRIRYRDQPPRH